VMAVTSKHAEAAAIRDTKLIGSPGEVTLSAEYRALARRLGVVGSALSLLVLVTIALMVIKP